MAEYRFLAQQRNALYQIVFGTGNTPARLFDIVLIAAILASVLAVMIESDVNLSPDFRTQLRHIEVFFTILFTIEYLLRIFIAPKPRRYISSFFGIIDLLAILPSYLLFIFPEASYFLVIRLLRVLRVFRIFKLLRHVEEGRQLGNALKSSSRKISVFFFYLLACKVRASVSLGGCINYTSTAGCAALRHDPGGLLRLARHQHRHTPGATITHPADPHG